MEDLKAELASLRTEVKYLKIIIPAACGFVALLILIFWGIERDNIGERVSTALQEHAVQQAIQDIEQAKDTANQVVDRIDDYHQTVVSKADALVEELEKIKNQSPWTLVKILSVDHGSGTVGQYFNFDIKIVDKAIGHKNWHSKLFLVLDTQKQILGPAKLWREQNGGSIGNGHGRWESGYAPGQWAKGNSLIIVSGPQN